MVLRIQLLRPMPENYNYKFEPIENYYNKFKLGDVNLDGVVRRH